MTMHSQPNHWGYPTAISLPMVLVKALAVANDTCALVLCVSVLASPVCYSQLLGMPLLDAQLTLSALKFTERSWFCKYA